MDRREWKILLGGGAANCVATGSWWLQPILMQHFVSQAGMSDAAAGLLLSAEVMALALVSALATRWLGEIGSHRRLAMAGTLLALLASILSLKALHMPAMLMALRVAAGAGAGLVLTACNQVGAEARDPEAMFAKYGFVNVAFGTALLAALQPLSGWGGEATPFLLLVFALGVLFPMVAMMPSERQADASASPRLGSVVPTYRSRTRIMLIAGGTFAISLSSGVLWAYYALIGAQTGLSPAAVEGAIGVAIFTAAGATLLAAVLGQRLGRRGPIGLGLALLIGAILVLSQHPGAMAFRVATCVNVAAVYFLLPYFLGAGTAEDSQRGAAYVGSAFFLAGAVSPLAGGLLVQSVGIGAVGGGVALLAAGVALLFHVLERPMPAVAPMSL